METLDSLHDFGVARAHVRTLIATANRCDAAGDRGGAERSLLDAYQFAKLGTHPEIQSEVALAMSVHYGRYREFRKELQFASRAVRLLSTQHSAFSSENAGLKKAIARSHYGSTLVFVEEYRSAHEQIAKALTYHYSTPTTDVSARYFRTALYHMGLLFHSLRHSSYAIEYLEKASRVERRWRIKRCPDLYGLLAAVYLETKDFERARECAETQRNVSMQQKHDAGTAMAYSALAEIAEKSDDLAGASRANERALRYAVKCGDALRVAEVLCNQASMALRSGSLDEAVARLDEAKTTLTGLSTVHLWERYYLLRAQASELAGDAAAALAELRQYQASEDRLRGRVVQQEIGEQEGRFRRRLLRQERRVLRTQLRASATAGQSSNPDSGVVHEQLLRRYPCLTPTELRVCFHLRLGHSTKEIAQRLGLSPHTVDGHRRAIRAKMRLGPADNLSTHLMLLE